jgi:hypothetical protein
MMTLDLWIEIAGYLACALVFATFCMRGLFPLRLLAVASNVAFIVYAAMDGLMPVLLLHATLLPLNLWRGLQVLRTGQRDPEQATEGDEVDLLLPMMRRYDAPAGTQLFHRGDKAQRLYYIAQGEVFLPEVQRHLSAGEVFGEVGLLAPDGRRRASAKCLSACVFYAIDRHGLERACQTSAAVGLFLARLMAKRLSDARHVRHSAAYGPSGVIPPEKAARIGAASATPARR